MFRPLCQSVSSWAWGSPSPALGCLCWRPSLVWLTGLCSHPLRLGPSSHRPGSPWSLCWPDWRPCCAGTRGRGMGRGAGLAPSFRTHSLVCMIRTSGSWVPVSCFWRLWGVWPASHSDQGSWVGPSLPRMGVPRASSRAPGGSRAVLSCHPFIHLGWGWADCGPEDGCHPRRPASPARSPLRKL